MCNCFGKHKKQSNQEEQNSKKNVPPKGQSPTTSTPQKKGPGFQSSIFNAKHSSPSAMKTTDLTEIFQIPTRQTVEEVAKLHGFELSTELGKGSYATVYKAKRCKDNKLMACKVMEYPRANQDANQSGKPNHNLSAKNELFILERINHPHIIKLFHHFMVDMECRLRFLFIFMQLAEGDSLSVYMRQKEKQSQTLPENECKRLAAQMITAINHMHSKGLCHRDIKMSNVLLDKDLNCLVADFGLSRVSYRPSKGGTVLSNKYCGTPNYMSPEILLANEYCNVQYNPFVADVWALGVLLWCVVNQGYPFHEKKGNLLQQMMAHNIKFSKKVAFKIDQHIYDIFYRMLHPNVDERIKMEQLMVHPWVAKEVRAIEEGILKDISSKSDSSNSENSKKTNSSS